MTQTVPSATLKDVFTAAVATYGGKDAPRLGSEWTQLSTEEICKGNPNLLSDMNRVGFSGQVNVNLHTGEIIIADRGTANLKNLLTDVGVAVDTIANSQNVAEAFASAGLAAAQARLDKTHVTLSAVYTTGHSLGGAEAEMQAGMLSCATRTEGGPLVPKGIPITNVSLDAPGIAGLANRGNRERYTSYNFSSQGDVVHLAGGSALKGTTQVSLPVGPQMSSTAGLMIRGVTTAATEPGRGWWTGGEMVADGLDNALHAHLSALLNNAVSSTALGDVPMHRLHTGMSSIELQGFYQTGHAQDKADATATPSAGQLPTPNGVKSFGLFGLDENGRIDSTLARNSAGHTAAEVDQWKEAGGHAGRALPQPKLSM